MRIVGGRWRGRALASPRSDAIRPTSDRLRETIFNVLAHAYDDAVVDARVLDLFAGTGAMGLEAVSRGAAFTLLVDLADEARDLIGQNIATLGAGASARHLRRDAVRPGPCGEPAPFGLVFCDPPYGKDLAGPAIASCLANGWLAPEALIVVEEAVGSGSILLDGVAELERRRTGKTEIVIGRVLPTTR